MGGLDGSWRVSEIAPLTVEQQIELAAAWFRHLDDMPGEASDSQSRRRAADFVAELQSNGSIAQLGGTPLLLTGLIALRLARLQLPRNRFLAYAELTKLLLETHPVSRDRAALAGSPRLELDTSHPRDGSRSPPGGGGLNTKIRDQPHAVPIDKMSERRRVAGADQFRSASNPSEWVSNRLFVARKAGRQI
jgi:hypothetical protein